MTPLNLDKAKTPEDVLDLLSTADPSVLEDFAKKDLKKEDMVALYKKHFGGEKSKKTASNFASTPESAKKLFDSYRKEHPSTTKKWQDFYQKSEKGSKDPTQDSKQSGPVGEVTKSLKTKEMKKALSPAMHEEMEGIDKTLKENTGKILKDPKAKSKIKEIVMKQPAMASDLISRVTFGFAAGAAVIAAHTLFSKFEKKITAERINLGENYQKTQQSNIDSKNKYKFDNAKTEFKINNREVNNKEFTTAVCVGLAGVAAVALVGIASKVAANKIMTQLYEEELRKPEKERNKKFIKKYESSNVGKEYLAYNKKKESK